MDSIQTHDETEKDLPTPYFTHPESMHKFLPKPSGNMAKMRCAAAGVQIIHKFTIPFLTIEKLPIAHSNHNFNTRFEFPIGNPNPNITWTKDSNEIVRNNGKVQIRKWAIILEDLTPKDSGNYTCKLCNIHGCIEHTTHLQVLGKLKAKSNENY